MNNTNKEINETAADDALLNDGYVGDKNPSAKSKAERKREKREKRKLSQVKYTKGEEIFNWVSHLAGLVLAVAASVLMIIKAAAGYNAEKYGVSAIVAVCLFSFGLIAVYSISTTYHLTRYGSFARSLMRRFDHCTITLLIAGSYMPYTLIGLYAYGNDADTVWAIIMTATVLAVAVAIITLNVIGINKFRYLTLALYLVMGWAIMMRFYHLFLAIGAPAFFLLLGGGVAYSVGVIFYKWKKMPFRHGIFHLFVIAGSALMFSSVYFFIL